MPCHIHFLGFVSCFLHQLMLINCRFVLAVRTVHSTGRQAEGEGFHITDFVLTVMLSDRVGTDYSPTPSHIVHTGYS